MKKLLVSVAVLGLLVTGTACSKQETAPKYDEKSTNSQKLSYGLGYYAVGQQLPEDVDVDALVAGIKDAKAKKDAVFTQEQLQKADEEYQKEVEAKLAKEAEEAAKQAEKSEAKDAPAAEPKAEEPKKEETK